MASFSSPGSPASSSRLFVSFSGGRTSGCMARMLQQSTLPTTEVVTIFANTGQEDEQTLLFVDECDKRWGLNVVWVEAVVHPERGVGTSHQVVNFATAHRGKRLFEQMIRKYGIPNKNFPHCTRELKLRPMTSYLRSIGWLPGTYDTAIGIRADEFDRIDPKAAKFRFTYPLAKLGVTKPQILDWWSKQPFNLKLPEHFGNCRTCWKKSERKLLTIAKVEPEAFAMNIEMEEKYAFAGAGEGPRTFFRKRMRALDLIELAKEPFEPFVDGYSSQIQEMDKPDGCSESCDVQTAHLEEMLMEEAANARLTPDHSR